MPQHARLASPRENPTWPSGGKESTKNGNLNRINSLSSIQIDFPWKNGRLLWCISKTTISQLFQTFFVRAEQTSLNVRNNVQLTTWRNKKLFTLKKYNPD